ncbi:MAG: MFS transporter [Hyphomicrobiaceae bacterium]|nr:MFS transporter [Hyphomicrobiaceae bacterium]
MPIDTAQIRHTHPTPARDNETLLTVASAHLISHFNIMVLPVLLPLLKDRLDVSFLDLGFALTAFSIVTGLTQAPMGFLVDKVGARPILAMGLLLGGFAFVSLALVISYPWLILVALLGGLANSVYHPADYALLSNSIPEDRIGRAFSVHTFAGFLGGAVAPLTLLTLADKGGLQTALVCAGLLGPGVAILVLLPRRSASAGHGPRRRPATGPATKSLHRIVTPTVWALTVFFTLLALANSAIFSFSVVALIAAHEVSFAAANAALTAYLAATAVGVLLGGALADKIRRHGDAAAIGFGLSAVAMLLVATLTLPAPALILAMGVSGIIFGLVQPARDMLVRRAAPPGAAGRVFGIVSTGFNIGGIIGPLLFGWLMDRGEPRWVFGAAVIFMGLTALFGLLEERRGGHRHTFDQ